MQNKVIAIKTGNYLYNHCYWAYKIAYPIMKKWQDVIEIKLLKSAIKQGDVVLDIGANIGFYTQILSKCVGEKGYVYAFEPDETNFGHLQHAVQSLNNVSIHQAAVGKDSGTITIFKSPMLNVDHRTYPIDNYLSKSEVKCLSIDDFLPDAEVGFIKMDIQGFEYAALQGMKHTLMRSNGKLKILMELWPAGLQKANASASEVVAFLEQCGYHAYLIEQQKLSLLTAIQAKPYDFLNDDIYFNLFVY